MYKGRTQAITVVANTNIPFSTVWNTNANTAYDTTDNVVGLLSSGFYDVMVNLVVTGSPNTTISAQLYADGVAIPEAIATCEITATTGIKTLTVFDTIRVIPSAIPKFSEISVRLSGNATVTQGLITVEKRK